MWDREKLRLLYKAILSGKKKVVGWGTGSFFQNYHALLPIPLAYLIDNEPLKWGQRKQGIPILPPSVLHSEDPSKLILLLYSSFATEIQKQINSYGPFESVFASHIAGFPEYEVLHRRVTEVVESSKPIPTPPNASLAIVIQGPIIQKITPSVVRFYRKNFPEAYLILSTWETPEDAFLKEAESFVDALLLSPQPDFKGRQNRNAQILSTHTGIQKAQNEQIRYTLKVRTDMVCFSPGLEEACSRAQTLYGNEECSTYGLQQRIVIPEVYTRKYFLYHPSDLVMFGTTQDLLLYWSCPYEGFNCDGQAPGNFKTAGLPPEAYFGRSFAERIGWTLQNTLEDSFKFYRDLFVVMPNDWFGLGWFKYPRLPFLEGGLQDQECLSHYAWQKIYFHKKHHPLAVGN